MLRLSPLFIAILFILISCKHNHDHVESDSHLGVLNHEFDIEDPAKSDFEEGLLLIHSFEYDDAMTAFQNAKKNAPNEIMAYWGEAMCHYKALWGLQDKRAGYAVLEEIGLSKEERLEKIVDPLEKDFWEGVEILYGDGTLDERNKKFNQLMGDLHKKYPENQEASAFYALSMMWKNGEDTDNEEIGKKSADIAKSILEENPLHPGALHYTIHAYDDPDLANLAMDAANKYAKVAPDAAHALHMPSHIYLALGMWKDVVQSNEVSYQASVNRMERLGLGDEARGYHSYAWLFYAYLQQGRVDDAVELLANMKKFSENTQSKGIRGYAIGMQSALLAETKKWPDDLEILEPEIGDLGIFAGMRTAYFKSHLAYLNDDDEKIKNEIAFLEDEIKKAELYVSQDAQKMCSSGPTRYAPTEDGIQKSKAVLNQLYAFQALLNNGDAEKYLLEAAELENTSDYSFGPADISYPSSEFYGEWLLENERYEDALEQFNMSMERAPNRRNALIGAIAANKALNNSSEVKRIEELIKGFSKEDQLVSN